MTNSEPSASPDFIRRIIADDLAAGRHPGGIVTRFPPEPNGYLHIGHAKSICLNFGVAEEFGGRCNLRFDDTNPTREEVEYVEAIKADIRWLGFSWEDREYYASDYFEKLYQWAVLLIRKGLAYVDDQTADRIRETRGTLTGPGTESPFRDRPVEENLDLFARMRKGEFPDGARVLRAKIDMAAANLNMRDPVLYRILHATHHRTGDEWCIYPMYDWAHGQSDSIEGVTHSLCDVDFENHRPLYDWCIEKLGIFPSRQYEFARGNVGYMVTSKRRLIELVRGRLVSGWDDPRMPTLKGLKRRGYTPGAIRRFWAEAGLAKRENLIEIAKLENLLREELNRDCPRAMAVLRPLRVVIENFPEGEADHLTAVNNPEDESAGTREVPFARVLYIERDDFLEDPPRKFYRLAPGREVRLRYGYFVTCVGVVKDAAGEITELRCTYDPETRGGSAPDDRKVKATLHWVSAEHSVKAEVRLYDHLFVKPDPLDDEDWKANLNPDSLETLVDCRVEPRLASAAPGDRFQFERLGYFAVDPDSAAGRLVFNRTVTLRDTWVKVQKQEQGRK